MSDSSFIIFQKTHESSDVKVSPFDYNRWHKAISVFYFLDKIFKKILHVSVCLEYTEH